MRRKLHKAPTKIEPKKQTEGPVPRTAAKASADAWICCTSFSCSCTWLLSPPEGSSGSLYMDAACLRSIGLPRGGPEHSHSWGEKKKLLRNRQKHGSLLENRNPRLTETSQNPKRKQRDIGSLCYPENRASHLLLGRPTSPPSHPPAPLRRRSLKAPRSRRRRGRRGMTRRAP